MLKILLSFSLVYVAHADEPKATKLPLGLVGTIIRADRPKSLATVLFKNTKATEVYTTGKKITTLALVEKIERDRVFIKNNSNKAIEYISLGAYDAARAVKPDKIGKPDGDREFHVRRSDVEKTLKNLPEFLNAARAEPVTGPTGNIEGFQLTLIDKNSLYDQLGLKDGDVLRSVNGEPLNSLQSGFMIFNQFKDSSMIELRMERNGKPVTLTYLIR
jgi:general secretion pathway protein C